MSIPSDPQLGITGADSQPSRIVALPKEGTATRWLTRLVAFATATVASLAVIGAAHSSIALAGTPVISAGFDHSCGVTVSGEGLCWGGNTYGQRTVPTGKTWASISTDASVRNTDAFTCGVTTTGEGLCWGSNSYKQRVVPTGKTWASISAGGEHACGVTTSGQGLCWSTYGTAVTTVPSGKTWASIAAGKGISCGVTTSGEGLCWGANVYGQANVPSGKTWASISAGADHSCGVTTSGEGFCWGRSAGNLKSVPAGKTWSSISASLGHSCGVTTSGEGFCWGSNTNGQSSVPTGKSWMTIEPGYLHTCGLTTTGEGLCWGWDGSDPGYMYNGILILVAPADGRLALPAGKFTAGSVSADTTPPVAPVLTGTPASPTSSTSASIGFTAEANATFTCSVDGAAYSPCTTPKTLSGLTEGAHSLAVKATDQAGNVGTAATANWTVDTTAPPEPQLSGVPASITNNTSASISFAWQPDATFTCSVDSGPYGACTSPKALDSLADGQHSLAVKATDQAGNASDPALVIWIVDSTAPDAPSVAGIIQGVSTQSTGASLTLSGEPGATFQCRLDGLSTTAWFNPSSPCPTWLSLLGLSEGSHEFSVRQTDLAGNTSAWTSPLTWAVDTTSPTAPSVSEVPIDPANSNSAAFTFSGEQGTTFECSTGSGYQACSSPLVLTGLTEGQSTLSVRQTDAAGITGPATTRTWTVDTTAPSAPTLTGVPDSQTVLRAATIGISGEAGAVFLCSIDGGSFDFCSNPLVLTGLMLGSHSVRVKQTDLAGNTSPVVKCTWAVYAPVVPISTPTVAPKPTWWTRGTSGHWEIKVSASTGGDTRAAAQLTAVQISSIASPATQPPRAANYLNNVSSYATSFTWNAGNKPLWIRVGNRAGKWSPWTPISRRAER